MKKVLAVLAVSTCFCAGFVFAQDDSPALGDVARQSRIQKQQRDVQSKGVLATGTGKDAAAVDAAAKDASPKPDHVFTNENLHDGSSSTTAHNAGTSEEAKKQDASGPTEPNDRDAQAEELRSQIKSQKDAVATLKQQIDSESDSIHYAGANCVANCVQWNERQKQKQDEVESMKAQLEEQQKKLEEMQESARKQGFGSSVYEP